MSLGPPNKVRYQDTSVFVRCYNIIKNREHRLIKIVATVVRAEALESLRSRFLRSHPLKLVTLNLLIECFRRAANREHTVPARFILGSKHQLPHQIVESGPQVL